MDSAIPSSGYSFVRTPTGPASSRPISAYSSDKPESSQVSTDASTESDSSGRSYALHDLPLVKARLAKGQSNPDIERNANVKYSTFSRSVPTSGSSGVSPGSSVPSSSEKISTEKSSYPILPKQPGQCELGFPESMDPLHPDSARSRNPIFLEAFTNSVWAHKVILLRDSSSNSYEDSIVTLAFEENSSSPEINQASGIARLTHEMSHADDDLGLGVILPSDPTQTKTLTDVQMIMESEFKAWILEATQSHVSSKTGPISRYQQQLVDAFGSGSRDIVTNKTNYVNLRIQTYLNRQGFSHLTPEQFLGLKPGLKKELEQGVAVFNMAVQRIENQQEVRPDLMIRRLNQIFHSIPMFKREK